jgi:hypothetical protein
MRKNDKGGIVPQTSVTTILGAGFSCEAGLPKTTDIVTSFLHAQNQDIPPEIDEEISHQLAEFWKYVFGYTGGDSPPSLEDHFTVLDLAANTGRNLGPNYPPKKLRAIRRLSIHRIFQILDRTYKDSAAISKLLRTLYERAELSVVSTNWDVVVEKHLRDMGLPFSYELAVESLEPASAAPRTGVPFLRLHGAANWIYCDSCRRLYVGEPNNGKTALHGRIYLEASDFNELCPANSDVQKAFSGMPEPELCRHCSNRLGARIATFSYRKEVSIPQFQFVWQSAFSALRDSSEWVFIGYSLPEADFEFRHLLKAAEKAAPGGAAKKIKVVLKDDRQAELRFRRFFGLGDGHINQRGLSDYADALQTPTSAGQ